MSLPDLPVGCGNMYVGLLLILQQHCLIGLCDEGCYRQWNSDKPQGLIA